jgi:hypothetical protein
MTYGYNIFFSFVRFINTLRGEPWYRPVCATEYHRKLKGKFNIADLLDRLADDEFHCRDAYRAANIVEKRVAGIYEDQAEQLKERM